MEGEDPEMLDMLRAKIQRLGKVPGTCRMEVDDTRDESIEDDDSATEEKEGGSPWPQSNGRNEE